MENQLHEAVAEEYMKTVPSDVVNLFKKHPKSTRMWQYKEWLIEMIEKTLEALMKDAFEHFKNK